MISIDGLTKTYAGGLHALKNINLEINRGEIFALLGPNGAGKTTLINIVCGIVNGTSGKVLVDGYDIRTDFRITRAMIGLVPQELPTESFVSVWDSAMFSRGLFGRPANPEHIEKVLKSLSLWDRKDTISMELSGGMKRRALIAKALAHEPDILFLDEPTAGVDVELRQDLWNIVADLRDRGVTVILTTHYIEEAERLADRVGVINNGEIILIEDKDKLMRELGRKQLVFYLHEPLSEIPPQLANYRLDLSEDRQNLTYTYDTQQDRTGVTELIRELHEAGIRFNDLETSQTSLEEIFVDLVNKSQ